MNELTLKDGKIIYPRENKVERGSVLLTDGKIRETGKSVGEKGKVIDCSGLYVAPGFIDLQTNGGAGCDLLKGEAEGIENMAKLWAETGCTSFLGTVITNPIDEMNRAIKRIIEVNPPNFFGIHIEGPFISTEKRGTHNSDFIEKPEEEKLKRLTRGVEEDVKIMTYAPEVDEEDRVLNYCFDSNIKPSIGHTASGYDRIKDSLEKGENYFTHLYNGMSGFHHRSPGCVGAALSSSAYVSLIADGFHLHPATIKMTEKTKGDGKICLVTDAMAAAGMDDGEYVLGEQEIKVKGGVARTAEGTLAGSTLTMDRAVKNYKNFANVSLSEAVRPATLNPASFLGISDKKGTLEIGSDGDLVVFNEGIVVKLTLRKGRVSFSNGSH